MRLWSPWNTKWYPRSFSEQVVKSAFELPWEATLPDGPQVLRGRAWAAGAPVKRVDVSTDDGASWQRAQLHEPNRRSAWVRFSLPWTPPRHGPAELLARATDANGLRQPDQVPFNVDGCMFWAVARHPVTVGQRVSRPASITSVVPVT